MPGRPATRLPGAADVPGGAQRALWLTASLWLAVVVVALAVRPPLPVDETRYLAVAWDMWLEGHYLVPYLNGETYSHKPPLLFWLMTAGWHLFGVNDWWPRLVAPLFGLGCLMLTLRLADALWPGRRVSETAPVLLFGALFWTLFSTLTMFDMLLAFFALWALLGLLRAARGEGLSGFIVAGVALGFSVLAKGPAILLHVLPVALAAPWWAPGIRRGRWYGGTVLAVALAVVIGLAWAIPAGLAGGAAYREAIFWGQSANRVVDSFAHARPFWWYAAVLPGLVLPWLVWPPLWRGFRRLRWAMDEAGVRICLVWFGTAFVVFSLISGKQLHYLLPEFPALALLAARAIADGEEDVGPRDAWLPGGLAIVIGALLLAAPWLLISGSTGELLSEAQPAWGVLVIAAGVLALLHGNPDPGAQTGRLASISVFAVLALHLAAAPILASRYDLAPMARDLASLQESGKQIAYFGKYHGQFHFLGRMKLPIAEIGLEEGDDAAFLAAHPDGVVVARYRNVPDAAVPLLTYPFRSYTYVVWPVAAMRAHPGLGNRR
jgi:4-amino-4-deoxy-L-arabinose transferase-like glycosyltransferase